MSAERSTLSRLRANLRRASREFDVLMTERHTRYNGGNATWRIRLDRVNARHARLAEQIEALTGERVPRISDEELRSVANG